MFKDIKDRQLFFVTVLLIILGTVALYLFLESRGISLNNIRFVNEKQTTVTADEYPGKIKLTSRTFDAGGTIPVRNSCKGVDLSPALTISGVPTETKSLAIIVEDPDSPFKIWTHWILYNIDPRTKEIYEGVLPWNSKLGENDFGVPEYRGPCPPLGVHRYFFRVYALDTRLELKDGSDREEIDEAMKNHILDVGELIGTFEKQ
jgi:Raf kinase inhibitor-like YbhB/YbcL family protein